MPFAHFCFMSRFVPQPLSPIAASVSEWSEATIPLMSPPGPFHFVPRLAGACDFILSGDEDVCLTESTSGGDQETISRYTPKYSQAVLDTFNCSKLVSASDAMNKLESQPRYQWRKMFEAQKDKRPWLSPADSSQKQAREIVEVNNVCLQ